MGQHEPYIKSLNVHTFHDVTELYVRPTYGRYERGVERVLAEPEQETCLPHAAVPDEQQLEQVVVCLRH